MVAPLRLSLCCGAPPLDIAPVQSLVATSLDSRPQDRSMLEHKLGLATETGDEANVL